MPDSIDFSRKPVLVLGASGFIGSRVMATLAENPIYRAIGASRRSAVPVEATDRESVHKALRDVDCVVNCVAGNDRTMVQATQVLCDVARVTPPRRIIHISSMAVYGAATGVVTEDQPPVQPFNSYAQAKIDCEQIVGKYIADGGSAVILRPTCVFGPGSAQWTTRIARLLKAGRIGDLGKEGDGCCNLAFIDDVATAVVAALDADVAGQTFNISSSSELTWNEFLMAFAKAIGATPVRRISSRNLRIETKLQAPIRRIAAMASRAFATDAITPSLTALFRQDIHIDCSAAQTALGLRQTSPDRMIAATLRDERGPKEPALP